MATKTENIETLYKAGVDTKTNLKKLDPEVLENMVGELSTEVPEVETEVAEETVTPEVKPEVEVDREVAVESIHQLGIFTEFIYHAKNEGVSIKVENLGNGDAYVSTGKVVVGDKGQRLLKGESVVIDAPVVNLMAASQPEIKFVEVK